MVPELRADGRVYWRADSDSQLTKGLAALLVLGLSGCTPQEIVGLQVGGAGVNLQMKWLDLSPSQLNTSCCC